LTHEPVRVALTADEIAHLEREVDYALAERLIKPCPCQDACDAFDICWGECFPEGWKDA